MDLMIKQSPNKKRPQYTGWVKKSVLSKNMATTTLKSIRKGKNNCVLENSAQMLQDRDQTFQNFKIGLEKWSWSWQTPSKNRSKLTALDFFIFRVNCSKPFYTNFEMFGAYPAAFKLNFPKHTNFFPFWWISEELWLFFSRSPFFLTHPVRTKKVFFWKYQKILRKIWEVT